MIRSLGLGNILWAGVMLVPVMAILGGASKAINTSQVRCIESERQALLTFKRGLEDYFGTLSSWTSGEEEDCCKWRGIKCDNQTNHVVALNLGSRTKSQKYQENDSFYFKVDQGFQWPAANFGGEIGFSLSELIYLEHMDFQNNHFTRIPNFIGVFTRLRYLNLADNPIGGTIPPQLGNLTSLRFLDLGGFDIIQIQADNLEWLPHLSSLKVLRLAFLNLTEPVNWLQSIKAAPSLTSLELLYCRLPFKVDTSTLSHSINSSNSLRDLDVQHNTINPTTLPWLLNVSSNLINLTIWDVETREGPFPDYYGYLRSLENIVLITSYGLSGIPKSMGNLCNLRSLSLYYVDSFFSGTLKDLLNSLTGCASKSLEILRLQYNQIRGTLPDLSQFASLRELYLAGNQLSGGLTEGIGQLINLEFLDLSSNNFTGVVSEAHLQKLYNLKYLSLSSNSLTLNFTSKWVPPFQLVALKLCSCKFGPPLFPNWLQTQMKLSVLDISNTGITDAIPDWFYNLTPKLRYLNLSHNSITSTILPKFPLSFHNYPNVDLSNNLLHGPIPLSLANATALNLSNNTFTLSESFFCIAMNRTKTFLDLSFNMLSGSLPDCWKYWQNLIYLNLGSNKLSGNIPDSLGSLYQAETLCLRQNMFLGSFPSSLKNCTSMRVLDAGENNLNGEIPTWIGEWLTKLFLLNLKSNKFYGRLPMNLCHLESLRILDLSLNDISGVIPSCFHNFTTMADPVQEAYVQNALFGFYTSDPLRGYEKEYINTAYFTWKGEEYKYDQILGLLRLIDLSSNTLSGTIPMELTTLVGLKELTDQII